MTDFYVYTHADSSGVVFYIGKGTGNRYKQSDYTHRSLAWQKVAVNGFTASIYKDNLSETEALTLEKYLILNPLPEWELVNSKLPDNVKDIEYELFNQYFEYSDSSPSGLVWKINKGSRARAGAQAGSISNKGYYRIKLNSVSYQAHRVIWVLHHKSIPTDMIINHIDGDTKNNRIDNLELCTKGYNNSNQKQHTSEILRKDNVSGVRGLSYLYIGNNYYAVAYRNSNKVTYKKYFNITTLGKESATKLAMDYLAEIDRIMQNG